MSTVAAVYGYFLIFAQFGFLKAVQAAIGENSGVVRPLMAMMGLAGIAGSVLAARVFAEQRSRAWLAVGFGACAAGAAGSMGTGSRWGFSVVAGLGVGLTTVTLAGMLRRAVGDARLGIGLAEGRDRLPPSLAETCAGLPTVGLICRHFASRQGWSMNENNGN